jgi:uncharacterized protein YeaO (DUF488 family)
MMAVEGLKNMIGIKRVFETPAAEDGLRVLVERLWPRGMTKERAAVDVWLKDVAPSPELRKWYSHDLEKWQEFRKRYRNELQANREMLDQLHRMAAKGPLTLVYAARDEQHNSALILKEFLEE